MALIDRGIASDQQLGKLGVPMADAVFVSTADTARNVRARNYPPARALPTLGFQIVRRYAADTKPLSRVFMYQTGLVRMESPDSIPWLPGALADHLTSFGGVLRGTATKSAMEWRTPVPQHLWHVASRAPCAEISSPTFAARFSKGYRHRAYWISVSWPAQVFYWRARVRRCPLAEQVDPHPFLLPTTPVGAWHGIPTPPADYGGASLRHFAVLPGRAGTSGLAQFWIALRHHGRFGAEQQLDLQTGMTQVGVIWRCPGWIRTPLLQAVFLCVIVAVGGGGRVCCKVKGLDRVFPPAASGLVVLASFSVRARRSTT